MTRFFLTLYRFFKSQKAIFYGFLFGSTILFGFFASRLEFVENILDLLPRTRQSEECSVAFGNIKIKDKLFVEVYDPDGKATVSETAAAMDEFVRIFTASDTVAVNDSLPGFIGNVFYRIDSDDIMNLAYYAMDALPCHLGQWFYDSLDVVLDGKMQLEPPSMQGMALMDMHLFSPDSTLALCFVSPSFDAMDSSLGRRFDNLIRSSISRFEKECPGFRVLYHGVVTEGVSNSSRILTDLILTVGISVLLICILIAICFGRAKALARLLLPVAYGTLFSMAVIYWIKGSMSFIAIGIGALVLGVALSYCLHVLTHRKFVTDTERMISEQARPVCLGCITTIGAFLGLMFTSSELLSDFGLFASLAMVGTTFAALVFLPQFFHDGESPKNEKAFDFINRVNSYPLDRNKPFVIALVLVCLVCIFFSGKVGFDTDLSHIGFRSPESIESETLYNTRVNKGAYNMYFAAQAQSYEDAIIISRQLNRRLDSLQKEGLIHFYSSMEPLLLTEDEQRANIDLWKSFWTPEKARRTAAKISELIGDTDTGGFDVPATFLAMTRSDFDPVNIYEYGALPESVMCNFIEHGDDGWLIFTSVGLDRETLYETDAQVADMPGVVVLDPFYYAGDMVRIVHDDFNIVLLISSIFVFLVLLLSFRSIVISAIAFLPMALSWYVVQGAMAIFGLEFNLINIMVSTFVFGIGVDYSIFVMEGLISKSKYNSYRLLVCHKSAIFFSGVTLIVVMTSLLFAKHPAIHSTGVCTIIGMSSTILITYALQPLLFRQVRKSRLLRKYSLHEKDFDTDGASL